MNGTHWSLMDPKEFTLISVPVEVAPNKTQITANELINQANVTKQI